MTVDNEG